jgi:acyl-coenzyme A thioesterase 9
MLAPLKPIDLRLSGQVIHVGKSSMDIVVQLESLGKDGVDETLMLGLFTDFPTSISI